MNIVSLKKLSIVTITLTLLGLTVALAGHGAATDESQLFGNWSGESICQMKDTACRDEKVVYRISKSKSAGAVMIVADKIVDGKAVTMGAGDWKYDQAKQTLILEVNNRFGRIIWELQIHGDTMEGTLTQLSDKTVLRRMKLKKDQ